MSIISYSFDTNVLPRGLSYCLAMHLLYKTVSEKVEQLLFSQN